MLRFSRAYSSQRRIRNIGIVAHVDAGKTTVTERLLYLAGAINIAGNVDKGTTVTDFLDIERERGITVQSAAVNLNWNENRINLIDTPGHVDFRVEVERCVRVLDGIVCVIDGSAGVQPQTLTVWSQASKFKLPSMFFVNKLDKKEADFAMSVDSIEQKLGLKAVKTVIPYGNLDGIVDIINRKVLKFSGNVDEEWSTIQEKTKEWDVFEEARSEMCYNIADNDDTFMNLFLDEFGGDHRKVDSSKLVETLRKLTLGQGKVTTVSCGSAIRSLHCVQPILDAVVDYFPSPDLRNTHLPQVFGDDLSGLVFKITHDKRRGQLSYIRVYTGKLQNNTTIYNATQSSSDGPAKVFVPYADQLKSVDSVTRGNIAVVSGLANTVTGDTVLLSRESAERAYENVQKLGENVDFVQAKSGSLDGRAVVFAGIDAPEPVYFCCIEPPSNRQQNVFNRALIELQKEDPSMRCRFDRETGQTIVETQGELHLEAIKHRLLHGYALDVFIGELQVAYREMLMMDEICGTSRVEDVMTMGENEKKNKKKSEFVTLSMRLSRRDDHFQFKRIELDLPPNSRPIRNDWQKAISEGCANALQNGPLASFPVHSVRIAVTEVVVSGGKINPALLSACAQKCVTEALSSATVALTEPVMSIEIDVRSDTPTQPILNELIRRRARIEFADRISTSTVRIKSHLPLAEMADLSRTVRTLTSGFGDMNVQVSGYQEVPDFERTAILERRRRQNEF